MINRQHSNTYRHLVDIKNDTKRSQKLSKELVNGLKRVLFGMSGVDWEEYGYCRVKRSST